MGSTIEWEWVQANRIGKSHRVFAFSNIMEWQVVIPSICDIVTSKPKQIAVAKVAFKLVRSVGRKMKLQ